MRVLEAAHAVFGCQNHLSVVDWTDETKGEISPQKTDMFAALNWLSIVRKSLEPLQIEANTSLLTEIHEGQTTFRVGGENQEEEVTTIINGNKIDTLRVGLGGSSEKTDIPNWNVQKVTTYIEGMFNSQFKKHRSYSIGNGERKVRATRLQRNLRSLFLGLSEHFGEKLFSDSVITIDDYKFPAGDGNWSEQYDPEELPIPEHAKQVSGYIFKTLAQLTWLDKWLKVQTGNLKVGMLHDDRLIDFSEKGDVTLTIPEVIEFGLRSGLLNRINARLLYQLPSREIVCKVSPTGSSFEELVDWGLWASKLDNPKTEQRDRLRINRAVLQILKPTLGDIEIKRKVHEPLPKEISEICFDFRGQIYLAVDQLANLISLKVNLRELKEFKAIDFNESGVKVMWLRGLVENARIRIAVDKLGNFAISGLDTKAIKGKLLSQRDNYGVHERPGKVMGVFESQIWNAIHTFWGLPKPASESGYIKGNEIIMPDGTIEKLVDGKPIVCRYDLLTGKWFLDYKLLEDAVGSDASRNDLHGLGRLAILLNRPSVHVRTVMCPMPTHKNINTPAGILNPTNINCQSGACSISIFLPERGKIRVAKEFIKSTDTTADFKPVSRERAITFEEFMKVGKDFAAVSEVPTRYIIEERGLNPKDLGSYAYIPQELDTYLEALVGSDSFKKLSAGIKHKSDYHLGIIDGMLGRVEADDTPGAMAALSGATQIVNNLPEELSEKVFRILNIQTLMAMKMRRILEPGNKKTGTEDKNRLGERIILPTYWISDVNRGSRALVQANFNARGIVLDGQKRFNDQDHHKAILTGKKTLTTPAGFYFRDPEMFLLSVRDTVVVTEGPFNGATLSRITPDLADITLTNVGLGYRELIAFLRWLGVKGDNKKDERGMNLNINTIYLSFDFDLPGSKSFMTKGNHLRQAFPGIKVRPVHELLPKEVRSIVPAFSHKLFEEGKRFAGFKLDLNDLVKNHQEGWASKNGINPDTEMAIADLKKKYGYFKPS